MDGMDIMDYITCHLILLYCRAVVQKALKT
jgi:hypothetical protein